MIQLLRAYLVLTRHMFPFFRAYHNPGYSETVAYETIFFFLQEILKLYFVDTFFLSSKWSTVRTSIKKDGLVKSLVATGIQDEIHEVQVSNLSLKWYWCVLGYLNKILN